MKHIVWLLPLGMSYVFFMTWVIKKRWQGIKEIEQWIEQSEGVKVLAPELLEPPIEDYSVYSNAERLDKFEGDEYTYTSFADFMRQAEGNPPPYDFKQDEEYLREEEQAEA